MDLQIKESQGELKKLLPRQKSITDRSRVKMLLLIKRNEAVYTKDLVPRPEHCRKSIYNWINLYRQGGPELLLSGNKGGNNAPLTAPGTKAALAEKLSDAPAHQLCGTTGVGAVPPPERRKLRGTL